MIACASLHGGLTWLGDLLEGNMSAYDVPVFEDLEEVPNFAALVPSQLDVPLWQFGGEFQQHADQLVKAAWHVPLVLEEGSTSTSTHSMEASGVSPLDTTPIVWQYLEEGVCVGSIWWDQHKFSCGVAGRYSSKEILVCGEG